VSDSPAALVGAPRSAAQGRKRKKAQSSSRTGWDGMNTFVQRAPICVNRCCEERGTSRENTSCGIASHPIGLDSMTISTSCLPSIPLAGPAQHRRSLRRRLSTGILLSAPLREGWLQLWFLELDGTPRAAWYGFRFGQVESYHQSGRDPASARSSIGFVLLAHAIREALMRGFANTASFAAGRS
jgi:hypothetical protein